MTRAEILAKVGRALNKNSPLDPLTKARLLDHVDRRHREILSTPGMAGLRRRQIRFTSVAGQPRYAFLNAETVKHLVDVTNQHELSQRALGTYRQYNPAPATTQGTPDGFIQYGFEPVQFQPIDKATAPGGFAFLFAKSDSAADITQTVTVQEQGNIGTATLNGLTPVAISGGGWFYLDKWFLSAPPAGNVTLHADSGTGPQLSILTGGQASAQWLALILDPTPSASLTYEIDLEFSITDMIQDTDEPMLPSDFHDVLELGAVMDELHHLDDSRTLLFQQRYAKRLGQLQLRLARMGTDQGPRGVSSRLGPWAPTGRW